MLNVKEWDKYTPTHRWMYIFICVYVYVFNYIYVSVCIGICGHIELIEIYREN
jgi:hypothetical protein